MYGINYNGVKPRPTLEDLANFVGYPIIFLDSTATFTRYSSLSTQLDGIGMMELEEQQRRDMVERQKADMIRDIAAATGQSAHMCESNQ